MFRMRKKNGANREKTGKNKKHDIIPSKHEIEESNVIFRKNSVKKKEIKKKTYRSVSWAIFI